MVAWNIVAVVEVLRSGSNSEISLVFFLLFFNSRLHFLLQTFCFIGNLFCDSFGWWLLIDVIFFLLAHYSSGLGVWYLKLWEFQRWWGVEEGFLPLWPSVVEAGLLVAYWGIWQIHFDCDVPVLSKPQMQEKFCSPIHSLLVFPVSGTWSTFIKCWWQLCLGNSKWQDLPSSCRFLFFVLGLTLG